MTAEVYQEKKSLFQRTFLFPCLLSISSVSQYHLQMHYKFLFDCWKKGTQQDWCESNRIGVENFENTS